MSKLIGWKINPQDYGAEWIAVCKCGNKKFKVIKQEDCSKILICTKCKMEEMMTVL